jgi:pyruvate/2-oxoglutarate dehydrogenase complex dihydrolipoamide dehydrogenase (E3) component
VRREHAAGGPGRVEVELEDGRVIGGEELLVAVGRRPCSEEIGLDNVGLTPGGAVEVDERLRVAGRDWLYAIGDVNGRALLTHMGKHQARVAADAILGRDARVRVPAGGPPRVIFTEPQVAAVGYTLAGAREDGLRVRALDAQMDASAGASFVGRGTGGTARLVVDERHGVVVGATFTGVEVAESLHAATIAVTAELPLARLADAVPCFPTRSEVWLALIEAGEAG